MYVVYCISPVSPSHGAVMKWFILSVAALFTLTTSVSADEKKPEGPVALKLVAKTDKYKFDGGGKTPDEYKKHLEELAKDETGQQKPKPPAVDIVLELTNTSKEEVTIYVGGDSNVYTFELTGGDRRGGDEQRLGVHGRFQVAEGGHAGGGQELRNSGEATFRRQPRASRYVYWTGPGDYKLNVTYRSPTRTATRRLPSRAKK